jgi:hypothetical protein
MKKFEIASDLVERGYTEDGYPISEEVFYVLAVDERGNRWIGPTLDPTNWERWFPVYGSKAYVASGQEAADCDAERTDRPYYPA